jgi:hypothetical protein
LKTAKHIKNINNVIHKCDCCAYETQSDYEWNRHIRTNKHKKRIDTENEEQDKLKPYLDAIHQLIEDNKKEMRSFLVDEFRKITETSITNNINHGTINNKFNINFFLNDQCKDAENMSDFIKRIVVSRDDLENNAQLGFVNGITKIFIDNLKQLDIHKRPIHCTDIKRETIYIKDDDKWTREEDDRKIRKAVQEISRKSVGTLIEWKQTNPDYIDGDSEFSQLCIPMLRHSIAGDDRETFLPKVVKNVLREVVISR